MSGSFDPAFKLIPKGKACLLIWRVEKLELKPVPRDQYGNFFTGDAYILLSQVGYGQRPGIGTQVKEIKGRLDMHIHYWLGSEATQDEKGVAAIKTVDMDDYMGGTPVQHREVEGSETPQFLNYFQPRGIRYMSGGVASGFNHVKREVVNKLYQVKGKHHVRVREVPLKWESMNEGDVFVLDLDKIIFVWIGKQASRTERIKGMEVAKRLRDERGGKALIRDVHDGSEQKDFLDKAEMEQFNDKLPLDQKRVKSAADGGLDERTERKQSQTIKLYHCRDEGGTLKVTEKKTGPLFKSDLVSDDSFIVDNGPAGVWVWNGKRASKNERQQAMRNAEGFIKKKGYPPQTPITKVCDGGEPFMFKALFQKWQEPQAVMPGRLPQQNRIAKTVQTKFDASTLHSNRKLSAQTQMVDDGSGKVEVYRVERSQHGSAATYMLVRQPDKTLGQFFGGDCYVIVYRYQVGGRENIIIYFWQGRKSTTDEKGASAYLAQELDNNTYSGMAVQVRVVQGKEPRHFMAIFQGKMIIFEGGKAGWGQTADQGPDDTFLLQVRGTSQMDTKAIQVDLTAESLNSNDVFVLFAKTAVFIWCGKGSTGDEREMAREVATGWSPREPTVVVEGQEKKDFWEAIGGKKPYSSNRRLQEAEADVEIRLFQCSNATGQFLVEEIPNFGQDDLVSDDVMILDAWDNVWVWVGEHANEQEKQFSVQAAQEYVNTDPSGRDPDTPIYKIRQGFEPPNFTGFFGAWDNDLWNQGKTFEQLKAELGSENIGKVLVQSSAEQNGTAPSFADAPKYPYDVLSGRDEDAEIPPGLDLTQKEIYLSEDEFKHVFGMTYEQYLEKPLWKQQQLKKETGLW